MPWFAWLLAKITGETVKGVTEVTKSAVEIPKTLVETEKARLEVLQLRQEREERSRLIVPATFEDVKQFDPKYRQIRYQSERNSGIVFSLAPKPNHKPALRLRVLLAMVLIAAVLGGLIGLALAWFRP